MINILLIYINIEFAFKWIGFTRKDNAKCLLQKYFVINKDYIIFINKHNICDDISSFLPKEEIYDPKLGDVKLNEIILLKLHYIRTHIK
jgi:hypothetical protein